MSSRFSKFLLLLLNAAILAASLASCGDNPNNPLSVDQETYRKMVSAFYTGVTALDVGDLTRASDKLNEATRIVPNEPAAWADLALLNISNRDLAGAAKSLKTAQDHSPPNSQLEMIAAAIEDQNGRLPQSLTHLKKAIELDPANLRARYTLTKALERDAAPGSDREIEQQFQQIVKAQPDNLSARIELARLAAKAHETPVLLETLRWLQQQSSTWSTDSKEQFAGLQKAANSNNLELESTSLTILRNILLPTPVYQQSLAVLTFPYRQTAGPVEHFLRLPQPRSTPAPPDESVTFTSTAAGEEPADWAQSLVISPSPAPEPGAPVRPESPPIMVWASGKNVHIGSVTLPFPGDKSQPEGVIAIDTNNDNKPDLVLAGAGGVRLFQQVTPIQWTDVTARAHLPAAVAMAQNSDAKIVTRSKIALRPLRWPALSTCFFQGETHPYYPRFLRKRHRYGRSFFYYAVGRSRRGALRKRHHRHRSLFYYAARHTQQGGQKQDSSSRPIQPGSKHPSIPQQNEAHRVSTGPSYTGAWSADIDLDGDLDIVLGSASGPPTVLQNNGDGSWAVIHPFPGVSGLKAFIWADLDGDGVPDAALIDGGGHLIVFSNQRSGHFKRIPLPAELGKVAALSVADVNNAGTLDLVVLETGGAIRRLTWQQSSSQWDSVEIARWAQVPTDGSARLLWGDLDNNGAPDLVASGSGGSQVWLGDEGGHLKAFGSPLKGRVLSIQDVNGDGRLDLVGVGTDGRPVQFLNKGSKDYHWQTLGLRADPNVQPDKTNGVVSTGNQKINSFGIGGTVELRAGLLVQRQAITGSDLHFGLGDDVAADAARITLPNGQPQGEFELKANSMMVVRQRLTGSCPWLFAWDGKAMKFITDILWKSPLGLRINAQTTAGVSQTRDWVKIRSDQLQPRDGFYDLRITAELWETDFFDMVRLMTVDHPAGTEAFVDERFSIPQPPLQLNVTGPVQPVARAVDDRGRDVTNLVRSRDGRYLDTFGLGQYQGLTRDHWVEVTLAQDAPRSGKLWLVLYGWIYPTDSSINVAISQGSHPHPDGLSLEVPDAQGQWRTVQKGLGFPAGKNKTVLLDLTGIFPAGSTGPRRLRLRTNLEIYWDSIGVAAGLPTAQVRTCEITPRVADLHARGFSSVHQAARTSPELPDYNHLASIGQQWLDLEGFYTRFGDVRPLLREVDDRYVIMNAGDEISLRFPASPPPPPGWVRDFVFVSDGWDKDGNFNTSFSKTVLPLPLHDHPAYNTPPGPLEQDPAYRRHPDDWLTYQTRYVTTDEFRRGLRPVLMSPLALQANALQP